MANNFLKYDRIKECFIDSQGNVVDRKSYFDVPYMDFTRVEKRILDHCNKSSVYEAIYDGGRLSPEKFKALYEGTWEREEEIKPISYGSVTGRCSATEPNIVTKPKTGRWSSCSPSFHYPKSSDWKNEAVVVGKDMKPIKIPVQVSVITPPLVTFDIEVSNDGKKFESLKNSWAKINNSLKNMEKSFELSGTLTTYFTDESFFEKHNITSATKLYDTWFEEDCLDCGEGIYEVDEHNCTCHVGNAPCWNCTDGDLVCTACGEFPPDGFPEDYDADGNETSMPDSKDVWDAIKDVCRGI